MPQTFLVVQCHECRAFQADLEKKAKKWQCKLCGQKQSLQRVFARSHSAKDCRLVVQQYNEARGKVEEEDAKQALAAAYTAAEAGDEGWDAEQEQEQPQSGDGHQRQPQQRWQPYQDDDDDKEEGWTLVVPERPATGKHKRGNHEAINDSKRARQQDAAAQDEPQRWGHAAQIAAGNRPEHQRQPLLPCQSQERSQQQQWQQRSAYSERVQQEQARPLPLWNQNSCTQPTRHSPSRQASGQQPGWAPGQCALPKQQQQQQQQHGGWTDELNGQTAQEHTASLPMQQPSSGEPGDGSPWHHSALQNLAHAAPKQWDGGAAKQQPAPKWGSWVDPADDW